MALILKLKHWQIFLILLAGIVLQSFTIEGNKNVTMILNISGTIIWFLWPLMVGNELYRLLPKKVEMNYTLFIINIVLVLTLYTIVMIISDGKGMTFTGIEVLPALYILFAIINSFAFPVRALNSIEKNKKASTGEYLGDFFLVALLPLGIWFLQPRINKVAENANLTDEQIILTDEQIINKASKVDGLGGMTVNERLYISGLINEFDRCMIADKEKARRILELLQVDEASINKIVR